MRIFLIRNSRRIETRIVRLLCLPVLIVFPLFAAESNDVTFKGKIENGSIYVSSYFTTDKVEDLKSNLGSGFRAEIIFQFRLYSREHGWLGFLGNRLLKETTVSRIARYDAFEDSYVIESGNRVVSRFKNYKDFISAFFTLENLELPYGETCEKAQCIIMGRAYFIPIKLISPLNLVKIFTSLGSKETRWRAIDLDVTRESER